MTSSPEILTGEFRRPRQMLTSQEYDGHASIHDDSTAETLGFVGAPIEGPTHFSQFTPLLHRTFGDVWFEQGCLSAHFQNVVIEGEEVQATIAVMPAAANMAQISAIKRDATPVLTGTASVGADVGPTELDRRMQKLRPADQLVLLRDIRVGQQGVVSPDPVRMSFDQHMGDLYPFTLNQKLSVITESHPWYTTDGALDSPWKRPVIPLEMASVLTQYTSSGAGFKVQQPYVGLFADQQIRMIQGPLFVDHPYLLNREIIALSESRRTESYWVKTSVVDAETDTLVAEVILNQAFLKDAYDKYAEEAAAIGRPVD